MGVHGPWQRVCVIRVRKVEDDVITQQGVVGVAIANCQVADAQAVAILIHDHGDQADLFHSVEFRAVITCTWAKVVHHRPVELNGDH
jgi:cobalamin biosynthesis protein CbiD